MTEISRQPPSGGGTDTLDWADPSDLPVEEVRDVFLTLSKALRAYQLYDPNNPVYKRFVSNLREALSRLWESREQLQILVEEDRFTWLGEEVYRNESRSDSLSFIFYRDGIRDLTLKKGLEGEELERLLDALQRAKSARQEGDDLATILWDLDLKLLGYSALDVAAEGVDLPPTSDPAPFDAALLLRTEVGGLTSDPDEPGGEEDADPSSGGAAGPQTVRKQDFNPTLYALDEGERRYLKVELRKELDRDLRSDVLNALFDRLEEPARPERQVEIMGVLRTLLPNFLGRGAVGPAATVVREIREMRARPDVLAPEADALVERLLDELSVPEVVDELVRALEEGTVSPDAEELSELFRYLRPIALTSLLKGSEETREEAVRAVLREAVHGIAEGNRDAVIRLLASPDPAVASGAVRLVGRMGITEASGSLARLLDVGPLEVRRVVIETAEEIASAALQGAVQRLLRDENRELRVAAARVLGRTRYAPAAADLRGILEGKELRQADVTEKVAFFEAYGMLAGEKAVDFLDKVLNGRGFLRRREPAEIRAGAALALGKIHSPAARRALDVARGSEEPVIRSAVSRALKESADADG